MGTAPGLGYTRLISKCCCGFHPKVLCFYLRRNDYKYNTFGCRRALDWVCGCRCVTVCVDAMGRNMEESRVSREGTEQAPGTGVLGTAGCWWSWIFGMMALTSPGACGCPSPAGCCVLQGWLGFLAGCPDLPWHGCPGILQSLDLFICERWCWWQGWVMELFSFWVLESTIWVVAQAEKSCR